MPAEITFVMPAYNAEKYIATAIESLQNQSVSDWKLIIVNDCSTDSTLQVAQNFACFDSRISVVSTAAPSGSAYIPRKLAVELSDTEYISPLDADDWIGPGYIEDLLRLARGHSVDIVFPSMWRAVDDGHVDRERYEPVDDTFFDRVFKGPELVKFTLDGWRIGANGGLLRRDVYLRALAEITTDMNLIYADELLTRHLLLHAAYVTFSRCGYFYRYNELSVTRISSPRTFEYLINNRFLIDLCDKKFSSGSEEFILAHRQNFHGIFNALTQLNRSSLNRSDRGMVVSMIEECRRKIDHKTVKSNVSPRYYALLGLPLPVIALILRIYDRLKG